MEYAVQLLMPIMLGLVLGQWMERVLDCSPLVTVILAVLGMVTGLGIAYKRLAYPELYESKATEDKSTGWRNPFLPIPDSSPEDPSPCDEIKSDEILSAESKVQFDVQYDKTIDNHSQYQTGQIPESHTESGIESINSDSAGVIQAEPHNFIQKGGEQ